MANEEESSWMQDLKDAAFVIKLTANKLYGFRNDRGVVSNEVDTFILENEAKLIRQFSRLLYLKLQNENESAAEKADAYGNIDLWLSIVNISDAAAKALKAEVKTVEELLHYNDTNMEELCDRCGIAGEDRRRFSTATKNLKTYTKRWLDEKREPKDEFHDSVLCWMSYERQNLLKSPNFAADNQNRRSVSESGVDSGASDSGLGSHPSQTSLPTASPPASPASFTGGNATGMSASGGMSTLAQHPAPKSPTLLFRYGTNAGVANRGVTPPGTPSYFLGQKQPTVPTSLLVSGAQAKKLASIGGKAPTTPPPSLRWGTTAFGYSTTGQPTTNTSGHFMTRSRSHESNLPNRIIRVDQTGQAIPATRATTPSSSSSSAQFILPLSNFNVASTMSPDQSITFSDVPLLSPSLGYTSPTTAESSQSLQVPKSPRGAVRMVHNINHRFNRMWKPSMSLCCQCNKVIGLSGEKCTDCKIKVHTLCKSEVGATCGLTPQRLRQIYEYIVQNNDDGIMLSSSPHLMDGKRSDGSLSNSMSSGVLSGDMPLSSSSSCTSSAPSTPAPVIGQPQPSPSVPPVRNSNFAYPDVPAVTVEEANELRGSQGSDHTMLNSREGSLTGAGSELTLSPEGDQTMESYGSNESIRHEFRRDFWSKSTIKINTWREWTIPIEDIKFRRGDPPPRRGRFGEVHRAYWHQDVAVKFLNMDHVADEKQLETFKLEVSTFRSTRHENLILFLGCCMNPPKLGIVMNWCRGLTLYTTLHLKNEPLDMNQIINIAAQVSQGMSYLHGKKIIHKDLRSKNVFIEKNRAIITDFGLFSVGRLLRSEQAADRRYLHVPDHWLCYLAPEIMRSLLKYNSYGELEELPFSNATDVYAFGTLWYELVTSEFPFKRQSPDAIIWQVGRGVKAPLNNIQPLKEVKDMLMQCWASKASDRHDFNSILKTFDKMPKKRLARSPSHPVHVSRSAEAIF